MNPLVAFADWVGRLARALADLLSVVESGPLLLAGLAVVVLGLALRA